MTELSPGVIVELAAGVRRVTAPNPSMMTGPGTNTYLFGDEELVVIDPGPGIERHLDVIERAGRVCHILVTHTHVDHSPAAKMLADRCGAELIGLPAPLTDHHDVTFVPDRTVVDGERLSFADCSLIAVHTPGHASNHLCFLHEETRWLVTGDHVIDGSTVVINPPDGDMRAYLESLRKVRDLEPLALLPGHGGRIDTPQELIDRIIAHRLGREEKVLHALTEHGPASAKELVPSVYRDTPEHLYGWAERSLLAHLLKLVDDGVAECGNGRFSLRAGG